MATPTADADADVTIINRTTSADALSFLRTPAAFRESAADDSHADADADADDRSSSSADQVIPILSAADVEQKNATYSAAEDASTTTVHIIKGDDDGGEIDERTERTLSALHPSLWNRNSCSTVNVRR